MSATAKNYDAGPEMEWDELAPGGEISATVLMASGFVIQEGQRVRERYRVERVLGEGAMGQVLAVSLVGSTDRQTYALKVVARPADTNGNGAIDEEEAAEAAKHAQWFAELLRQEAAKQDVVQRHGVSVARLFALVQLDDGSLGMRMELARGSSLEARIEADKSRRDKAPDVLAAVMMVRKLVSQLRRLHEMVEPGSLFGFIHSDIKPGNVFVDDSDASDLHVTLLDFGVATAGQAMVHDLAVRHSSRKTFVLQQTGGTLGYAPPYHFTGKATPLSDVYAAIVILYELITLEQPWDFGDLDLSPDNILMIEAAMLGGPRPVRAVRPSIPADMAATLDAFFTAEFASLHKLAESASQALSIPDEDVQRAMTERLTRLARDYQGKLDQLAKQFSTSRVPAALAPAADATGPSAAARPTVPNIPRPAPLPRISEPGLPGLAVLEPASSMPAEPPRSVRPPTRGGSSKLAWAFALLAIPVSAGGAYLYLQSQRRPPPVPSTPANAVALANDGGAASADAASQVPTGLTLAALNDAPVVRLRGNHARAMNRAAGGDGTVALAAGAQRCSCLAPVRGARIVARGGALGREVTLCTASDSVAEGRVEFYGSGVIPAEVFTALPQITCIGGDETLELIVRRYAAAGGTASLFQCRRRGGATVATGGIGAPRSDASGPHGESATAEPAAADTRGQQPAGVASEDDEGEEEEETQPTWNPPSRPIRAGEEAQGGSEPSPSAPQGGSSENQRPEPPQGRAPSEAPSSDTAPRSWADPAAGASTVLPRPTGTAESDPRVP